ncbi:hypothetical protein [Halopseudomonas aestusnigri]|uniref:hypothetical protein n=1 Tax=Halopseudomonas aestusnigri TaxID=857252 RepID=UPI003001855F
MDVSSLLASASAVSELAKLLVDERDRHKAAAIKLDFTEKLMQVNSQVLEVQNAIISKDRELHALQERIRELEAHEADRLRYQLREVGTHGSGFAYQLRPASELPERTDEPQHFICQPCLDIRQHKAVLVRVRKPAPYWVCPACKAELRAD